MQFIKRKSDLIKTRIKERILVLENTMIVKVIVGIKEPTTFYLQKFD